MQTVPIIPLRGMTILPEMLVHFDVERSITVNAVEQALETNQMVFLTSQKNSELDTPSFSDLLEVGVYAKVKQVVRLQDSTLRVMVATKARARLLSISQTKPFLVGDVEVSNALEEGSLPKFEEEASIRSIKEMFRMYMEVNPTVGKSVIERIRGEKRLGALLDLIAMHIVIPMEDRQEVLECFQIEERYDCVLGLLANELEIARIKADYKEKVEQEVHNNQKEYFLREQMRVIRNELGENAEDSDVDKYLEQMEKLVCSKEVRERIKEEVARLRSIPSSSSENVVARGYIEMLLSLPWDKMGTDNNDLKNAESILEEDHYGLQKVKERILEFLAVRSLTGKGESPIVCLVGPPGTGKTSIARSVARALEKKYIRICLGGIRDEAEIRGHRRTYVGAMPGRLADGLKKAKVKNPLILLDEIDKVSSDYKGDTSSALLEVLDPEQNRNFIDHYIDLPMDLSEVLFLCTANTVDTIPRPLLDRMELIEISGYTENEKYHIAKEHLLPKQIEKNGLKKKDLSIGKKAMETIILSYTREAGVRQLERQLGKICRKTAKAIVNGEQVKTSVSVKNVEEFLGHKRYDINMANKRDEIGIVRGLAWTNAGGDTLEIEVNIMPGKGNLELTGQLGDVMQESAKIALSYVRTLNWMHKKEEDFFEKHDIHLHVPEGAVPKDGPSAGITMVTAIYSAVAKRPVRANLAMTGEVTLRGRVLPIGGLKEKLLAAKNAGITCVLVPERNKPDVEEMEQEVTDGLTIQYVERMEEVLKEALA